MGRGPQQDVMTTREDVPTHPLPLRPLLLGGEGGRGWGSTVRLFDIDLKLSLKGDSLFSLIGPNYL